MFTTLLLACVAGTISDDHDDTGNAPWGWDGGATSGTPDDCTSMLRPDREMPATISTDDTGADTGGEVECTGGKSLNGNFDVQLQGAELFATALFGDAGICTDVTCQDTPWLSAWVATSGACSDPDGAADLPAATTPDGALVVCWQGSETMTKRTSTCTLNTTAGQIELIVTLNP